MLFDQWCSDTVLIRSIYLEVFQNPLDVWSLDVNAVEPHYKQIDGAQKICCEMKKRRQHAKFVGAQASSSWTAMSVASIYVFVELNIGWRESNFLESSPCHCELYRGWCQFCSVTRVSGLQWRGGEYPFFKPWVLKMFGNGNAPRWTPHSGHHQLCGYEIHFHVFQFSSGRGVSLLQYMQFNLLMTPLSKGWTSDLSSIFVSSTPLM